MSHIEIEASARTHKKFLKAGPAASWLWVCGLGYCQDGLTDGFIPEEALHYLGVKTPGALKDRLVTVGLWDVVTGGWHVHDYLKHNRSSTVVNGMKQHKRVAGKAGGVASGEARREAPASTSASSKDPPGASAGVEAPGEPISDQIRSTQIRSPQLSTPGLRMPPLDVDFAVFREKYPASRRKGGMLIEQAFMAQSVRAGGPSALMAALDNHLASEQWQSGQHVPGMDVWLNQERWRQVLEPVEAVSATGQPEGKPDMYGHFPPCANMQECTRKALDEARAKKE